MRKINARNKGRAGEQEICRWLNSIEHKALRDKGYPVPEAPSFQRNQNQTAVGGSDITNPYGLCIEVKRQEALSIDTWWEQCCTASRTFGGEPILLYRQNGKRKWHAVMFLHVPLPKRTSESSYMIVRGELMHEDFERYLYTRILEHDKV